MPYGSNPGIKLLVVLSELNGYNGLVFESYYLFSGSLELISSLQACF